MSDTVSRVREAFAGAYEIERGEHVVHSAGEINDRIVSVNVEPLLKAAPAQ